MLDVLLFTFLKYIAALFMTNTGLLLKRFHIINYEVIHHSSYRSLRQLGVLTYKTLVISLTHP